MHCWMQNIDGYESFRGYEYLDLVCSRHEYLPEAQAIFSLGYARRIQLELSALSFVNAVYVGRKYRFSASEMKTALLRIASFATIIDLTGDVVSWALSCNWDDYEDVAQYRSAVAVSADCIITRNKKDFSFSKLPVLTPDEFLRDRNFEDEA